MISEDVREWVDEFARDAITKSTELGLVNYEAIAVLDWLGSQHEPDALRELIANEAHAVWADWYMLHGVGAIECGDMARTHYIDLTEAEKDKYRQTADRYLKLMGGVA